MNLFRSGLLVMKNNGIDYLDNGCAKQTVSDWLTMWAATNIQPIQQTQKALKRLSLCAPTIQYHLKAYYEKYELVYLLVYFLCL